MRGIELSYVLPNRIFDDELNRLSRKAISEKKFDNGIIEIILGEKNRSPGEHDWNHGLRYGANIYMKEKKIQYWASDW